MKRLFTFIVLLGIVMSVALTGCEQQQSEPAAPDTNAVPAAPPAPEAPATK